MNFTGIKRQLIFAAAIASYATGAVLCMRANLGSIPALCPAYVLSCIPGQELSVGVLTIIMHLVFLAIQAILLRSKFPRRSLWQIPGTVVLGMLLDLAMRLTQSLQVGDTLGGYVVKAVLLIVGASLVYAGLILQNYVKGKSSEQWLVYAFAKTLQTTHTTVALVFNIALIATGLIFCLFYFGTFRWDLIGIGTLLTLLLFTQAHVWLSNAKQTFENSSSDLSARDSTAGGSFSQATFPLVITIARMHGSGGRDIGYKVAQRLGINFYDKEIITETAQKLGIDKKKAIRSDQDISIRSLGRDGAVFAAQSQIIKDAAKESCVIIGRCADYILRGRPYCLNIFVRSDEEYAVTLIRNKDNLSESQAREVIRLKNNARERHYAHYTGEKWQDPSHYDLVINSAKIGVESAVDIICNAVTNITAG